MRLALRRLDFVRGSLAAAAALAIASWWFILAREGANPGDLVASRTWSEAARFVRELIGVEGAGGTPAFRDLDRWRDMAGLAYDTVAMSVLAIGIAATGMLMTVIPAARTAATGDLTLSSTPLTKAAFLIIRAFYVACRGVPELIWAMLIVFVLSPGILPGALALGVHNLGILGKLCAEVVEDVDPRPGRALRASGAGNAQVLFYSMLPQALPQFLMYTLYRWEVIIRTTVVVGLVSAVGLGREFRLQLSFFHYTDVGLILATYFIIVVAVDAISAGLRRLAR